MGSSVSKSNTCRDDWSGSLSQTCSVPTGRYKLGFEPPNKCRIASIRIGRSSALQPVKEEAARGQRNDSPKRISKNHAISSQIGPKPDYEPHFNLFRKSFTESRHKRLESAVGDGGLKPGRALEHSVSKLKAPYVRDFDMSIGLRVLLDPALEQSHNIASLKRGASFKKPTAGKGDAGLIFMQQVDQSLEFPRESIDLQSSVCDDVDDGELFDPSLLAAFEKAVESLSDDGWPPSEIFSSDSLSSSFEALSDFDSPKLPGLCNPFLDRPRYLSCLTKEDYLEKFERRGPLGCDNKVVLYFTSMQAVRKTFEECRMLRLILSGFGVKVDERDVWMHSSFREELTAIMGQVVSVPRLFIMGRYIGGAEEVESLHEEGVLNRLLEGLPTQWRQPCEGCGDVRFIPCTTCSGSCKIMSQESTIVRCPDCNENGLIMCPMCVW